MDQICLVVPVQSGKSDDAREFMDELEQSRMAEYAASEERIGITKEVWFLAGTPGGETLVASPFVSTLTSVRRVGVSAAPAPAAAINIRAASPTRSFGMLIFRTLVI